LFSAEYVENQLWGSPPSATRSDRVVEGQGKSGLPSFQGKPRLLRIAVAESRSEIIINRRGSHRQDARGSHRQDACATHSTNN